MIKIGKPSGRSQGGWTRVAVPVTMDSYVSQLWIEVEDSYASGLCSDRVDGFVVGLLSYAIRNRHDIAFEAPITNVLKEQIERDFVDVICQNQPELYRVKLHGPTVAPIFKSEVVRAMGLSCGVDCLYTVHNRMLDPSMGRRYFLVTDAHLRFKKDTDDLAAKRFRPLLENGKEFADKLGIPLIVARTNWGERCLPGLDIHNNTSYCNCFVAMSLQNLISHYYLASGGPVRDFATRYLRNGFEKTDCSNYDLISLGAYSTPAVRFIVDGLQERIVKIRTLLNWPSCWDYLDVCEMHRRRERGNDTYDCHKCMHTVNEIMSQEGIVGLEKFARVFDVDYVKKHRAEYLAYLMCQRIERSEVGLEAWNGRAREGCSCLDYVKAMGIIGRKILHKYIRYNRECKSWADI